MQFLNLIFDKDLKLLVCYKKPVLSLTGVVIRLKYEQTLVDNGEENFVFAIFIK